MFAGEPDLAASVLAWPRVRTPRFGRTDTPRSRVQSDAEVLEQPERGDDRHRKPDSDCSQRRPGEENHHPGPEHDLIDAVHVWLPLLQAIGRRVACPAEHTAPDPADVARPAVPLGPGLAGRLLELPGGGAAGAAEDDAPVHSCLLAVVLDTYDGTTPASGPTSAEPPRLGAGPTRLGGGRGAVQLRRPRLSCPLRACAGLRRRGGRRSAARGQGAPRSRCCGGRR